MDFVARPLAPPPTSGSLWQTTIPMSIAANNSNNTNGTAQLQHPPELDYHFTNGTRTFSSPPSTPMTPVPHHLQHMGGFPVVATNMDPSGGTAGAGHHPLLLYNIPPNDFAPPPTLSHIQPNCMPCEYRLYTLCQELQHYPTNELTNDEASKAWWDRFMLEYFHELATIVIEIDFGDGMQRYSVSHNYISWFFKSILHESGINRYSIVLGHKTVTTFQHQHQLQRVLCHNAVQELDYVSPHLTKVCCQGQLLVDFTLEDKPRVVQWVFHVVSHVELIPRFCLHAASLDSSLSNNLTLKGLPAATQALLQQLNQTPSAGGSGLSTPGAGPPTAPPGGTGNNNNIGPPSETCPPQLINYQDHLHQGAGGGGGGASSWRDNNSLQTSDGGSTTVLSHPPLPVQMTQSPPPNNTSSTPQLSSSAANIAPPTSNTSPITSPIMQNVSLHSNGSTCSVSSSCSSIPPLGLHQPHSHATQQTHSHATQPTHSHTASNQQTHSHAANNQHTPSHSVNKGSSKKNGTIPTVVKAHKFMIATEPAYFNEEMVHGEDERLITRIENRNNITTPTSSATPTDSDIAAAVTTPTTQQLTSNNNSNNITLSWLDSVTNSVQCSWNIQLPPEQR